MNNGSGGKKNHPHPLLGFVDEEDAIHVPAPERRPSARRTREDSMVGKIWDDEKGGPVEPPPPLPPWNVAEEAERAEPGLGTLARKVAAAGLKKLAKLLDPDS